jgi:hypothetical protein
MQKTARTLAAVGVPQEGIAAKLGISVDTLTYYYRAELDAGAREANAAVAGALYKAATGGNITAQIFWLKTRAGWRETYHVDNTSSDGTMTPTTTIKLIGVKADGSPAD